MPAKPPVFAKSFVLLAVPISAQRPIKITGTGAGGDIWQYQDCGAQHVLDFTDAGHASTMGLERRRARHRLQSSLIGEVDGKVDVIVAEIADGLLQSETQKVLLSRDSFRRQGRQPCARNT